MSRYVLVPLVLALSASAALAVCPTASRPVVISRPVVSSSFISPYVAPTVIRKVVATELVTPIVAVKKVEVLTPVAVYVPVTVPVYSAVYVPPYGAAPVGPPAPAAAPAAPAPVAGLAEIMAELRKINGRLDALEKGPKKPADPFAPGTLPPPTPAPVKAADLTALSVVTAKCAKCHDAKVSATEGKGLTLIDAGVLSKITDKEANKVIRDSYNGRMPKKGYGIAPLTDEETAVIVAHYTK